MSNKQGFTLIEVLIALAILSIALTTIIKFTSQNIRDTAYIQNKTIANWVGTQVINEVRAGILKLPSFEDSLKQTTDMLDKQWTYQANLAATSNPHIQKIHVELFQQNKKILTLVSYLYVAK